MDRSRAIFEWVFGLPPEHHQPSPAPAAQRGGNASSPSKASSPYTMDFLSVADQVQRPRT